MKFGFHRNVHPNHFDGKKVTLSAFSPTSEEDYMLSVDAEEIWTAKQSHYHRTTVLQRRSVGVWTISGDKFAALKLPVEADPALEDDATKNNPSHSLVIFPKDRPSRRDRARRLAALANDEAYSKL